MVLIQIPGQVNHNDVKIVDTVMFQGDKIIRYTDYSWKYLSDSEVKDSVSSLVLASSKKNGLDSSLVFSYRWNTNITYSRDIDLRNMNDTITLNLLSSYDPNVYLPQVGSITSYFGARWGKMHKGVDINLNTGDKVHAAFGGKVRYSKFNKGGYGNLVIIRHYNGLETYYAHLSKLLVSENQVVKAGEAIGLGGNTGHSFGSHLHFEIRYLDNALDPQMVFDFKHKKLKATTLKIHKSVFIYGSKSIQQQDQKPSKKEIVKTPLEISPVRKRRSLKTNSN